MIVQYFSFILYQYHECAWFIVRTSRTNNLENEFVEDARTQVLFFYPLFAFSLSFFFSLLLDIMRKKIYYNLF